MMLGKAPMIILREDRSVKRPIGKPATRELHFTYSILSLASVLQSLRSVQNEHLV